MPRTSTPTGKPADRPDDPSRTILELLRSHYLADRHMRRGLCLLNAGRYEEAAAEFKQAEAHGGTDQSLPSRLAACLIGASRFDEAAGHFARETDESRSSRVALIRRALAVAAGGNPHDGINILREAIREDSECAELHFQLGTILSTIGQYEEAELRFAQAINVDRRHSEALVNLALCCGMRGDVGQAFDVLQRAQGLRPHDTRIAILLAQAAQAQKAQGRAPRLSTSMPDESLDDDQTGIHELARAVAAEPDFVDAFLSIPDTHVDHHVYSMLLNTLGVALAREPEHAELHFHCGRVLERLGRHGDAIVESEAAVRIKPAYTRALIELAKLYKRTDRHVDAAVRLEQAVVAGAEYADVYVMLGELYQQIGDNSRARAAYQRAIHINHGYEAAHSRLALLPT